MGSSGSRTCSTFGLWKEWRLQACIMLSTACKFMSRCVLANMYQPADKPVAKGRNLLSFNGSSSLEDWKLAHVRTLLAWRRCSQVHTGPRAHRIILRMRVMSHFAARCAPKQAVPTVKYHLTCAALHLLLFPAAAVNGTASPGGASVAHASAHIHQSLHPVHWKYLFQRACLYFQ